MAQHVVMPSISFVVARSYPGCVIGCENKLPWHLKTDLQRFRRITTGHAVIMGSKTFSSIGRPLPNRTNIILSRENRANDGPIAVDDQIFWANSREAALYLADLITISREQENFFVIGGQEIYKIFFSSDLINKVYLTEVFANVQGDAFFSEKFPKRKWKTVEEGTFKQGDDDEYSSRFVVYERRQRRYRARFLSSFYKDVYSKNAWIESYLKTHEKNIRAYEESHQMEFDLADNESMLITAEPSS